MCHSFFKGWFKNWSGLNVACYLTDSLRGPVLNFRRARSPIYGLRNVYGTFKITLLRWHFFPLKMFYLPVGADHIHKGQIVLSNIYLGYEAYMTQNSLYYGDFFPLENVLSPEERCRAFPVGSTCFYLYMIWVRKRMWTVTFFPLEMDGWADGISKWPSKFAF